MTMTIDEMLNAKSPGAVVSRMWNKDDGGFLVEVRWWSTSFPAGGLRKAVGVGKTREEAVADACGKDGERVDAEYMAQTFMDESLPDDWVLVIDDVRIRGMSWQSGQHIEIDVEVLRSHIERVKE